MPNEQHTRNLQELYGVKYYESSSSSHIVAPIDSLYYYEIYIGHHDVVIERGDCAYWISEDGLTAHLTRGYAEVHTTQVLTIIRGYMPENKMSEIKNKTCLPYINGCSTKQIFPPDRLGDPTLQMLLMPPNTEEQAHHIHSTVRVVYVQSGSGYSIVGMKNQTIKEKLYKGKVIVLNEMCPHHFKTENESLVVIPLHVWSSVASLEQNHPMFNGTHQI